MGLVYFTLELRYTMVLVCFTLELCFKMDLVWFTLELRFKMPESYCYVFIHSFVS